MWLHILLLLTTLTCMCDARNQARQFKKIGLPTESELQNFVSTSSSSTRVTCTKACVDWTGCRSFAITLSGECRLYDSAFTTGTNTDTTVTYYIRQGEDIQCIQQIGFEYNGYISTSASNKTCLWWDSIPTLYPASSFIDGSLERAENLCREPLLLDGRPWCYVSNTEWEYCNTVGFCCLTYPALQYTGNISRTQSGRTCQRWDSQFPHTHGFLHDTALQNYCRATVNDRQYHTWCYTIDPNVRWEDCAAIQC